MGVDEEPGGVCAIDRRLQSELFSGDGSIDPR